MSSTNRGAERSPFDFYQTPAWTVHSLLKVWQPPPGATKFIEPCAGKGAIIKAYNAHFDLWNERPVWDAIEIDETHAPDLWELKSKGHIGNFTTFDLLRLDSDRGAQPDYHVAMTNPPFELAVPIIDKCLDLSAIVVMLLRTNFIGAEKRNAWWRAMPKLPDIKQLGNRVDFDGRGGDSCEYGWFIFNDPRSPGGTYEILESEPAEVRGKTRKKKCKQVS